MKKSLARLVIFAILVGTVFFINNHGSVVLHSRTERSFGELLVDFHVASASPVFNLTNMKPGNSAIKSVDVKNKSDSPKLISVKGKKTGGIGNTPMIETILQVTIKDGPVVLYGPKAMSDFFSDSNDKNGIPLNIINKNAQKTYRFQVDFPQSAGNEFQAKSVIADLTFGNFTENDLVIQEVFYNVDDKHGYKEPKDQWERDEDEYERRHGAKDKRYYDKKRKTRLRFQWIEIYNPTDKEISLKNWRLINEDGNIITISANRKIKPKSHALLSKDSSLWRLWNISHDAVKIEVGAYLMNGLDIDGDLLMLVNPDGKEVDRMSWGDNTGGFTPPDTNSKVPKGHSTERLRSGFDTNSASDWRDRNPPTPGD